MALATAVLVIELADVPHGFWVLLGTIAALRSSAWDTRASATRAVAGTAVGVAAASAVLWAVGDSRPTVWALLPVAVFIAALAAGTASFQTGQAAFTFTVLVLLRVLHPTANFGLLRLDDVATGCAVAVVVGLLCWPRGAEGVLGRALADALGAISETLRAAVRRLAGDPAADTTTPAVDQPATAIRPHASAAPVSPARTMAAFARLDVALRQYRSERQAKNLADGEATMLFADALRARIDAELVNHVALAPNSRPSAPPLPAVAAGHVLDAHLRDVEGFYRQIGEPRRRRGSVALTVPATPPAVRQSLADALLAAARSERFDQQVSALTMAWLADALEDQRATMQHLNSGVARLADSRRGAT